MIYPAKGSTKIAALLEERFQKKGIKTNLDTKRGLDHGSWMLLSFLYPKADIPVVQVSVNASLPAREQIEIGEALQGLGEQGILIIGSGAQVHNFSVKYEASAEPVKWAVEFDDWLVEKMKKRDVEALSDWENQAPSGKRAVPTAEHFVPLLIAYGSGNPKGEVKEVYRKYEFGSVSYLSMQL